MRILLPVALILACLCTAAQDADSTRIRKAEEHLKAGRCKELEKELAELLARSPAESDAVLLRAKCKIRHQDRLKDGMADLAALLEQDRDNFKVLVYRGNLYNDLKMFDRAQEDLERAVELAPDTAALLKALNRSSWNHLGMRRFDQSRKEALRALELDSLNEGALNNLAMVANATGDTATSHRVLKTYLRAAPESPVAWANMGFFLGNNGRHKEALVHYDQAEKLGWSSPQLFNNRGYSKLGVGDVKGARKDIETAIRKDPSNAYAYRNLAHLELHLGRTDAACSAMEKALQFGFTKQYGNEIVDLRRSSCGR
jgi:tetratricopeptide (TPR) repeat protein